MGQAPLNPFRYSARRLDSGTVASTGAGVPAGGSGYDMGARRYGPDLGGFYQADVFHGSLADLGLSLDPLTQNRYALAAGNPVSYTETDGHALRPDGGSGAVYGPRPPSPPPALSPPPDTGDGGGGGGCSTAASTPPVGSSDRARGGHVMRSERCDQGQDPRQTASDLHLYTERATGIEPASTAWEQVPPTGGGDLACVGGRCDHADVDRCWPPRMAANGP